MKKLLSGSLLLGSVALLSIGSAHAESEWQQATSGGLSFGSYVNTESPQARARYEEAAKLLRDHQIEYREMQASGQYSEQDLRDYYSEIEYFEQEAQQAEIALGESRQSGDAASSATPGTSESLYQQYKATTSAAAGDYSALMRLSQGVAGRAADLSFGNTGRSEAGSGSERSPVFVGSGTPLSFGSAARAAGSSAEAGRTAHQGKNYALSLTTDEVRQRRAAMARTAAQRASSQSYAERTGTATAAGTSTASGSSPTLSFGSLASAGTGGSSLFNVGSGPLNLGYDLNSGTASLTYGNLGGVAVNGEGAKFVSGSGITNAVETVQNAGQTLQRAGTAAQEASRTLDRQIGTIPSTREVER
jgi:hypothetical protein